MDSYNTLTSAERKSHILQIIQDCRRIADAYVKNWEPIDKSWPIVEGCSYLRLSDDKQVAVEKGSLEQQIHIAISEALIRSKSDETNYRIVRFFIEPGITGRHDRRPEFHSMRREIGRGIYRFVVFKELARIAREVMIWKKFFLLCIEKECEIFIRGLPINPNDPTQILQLDILAAFAEYESNQISKRTRESNFSAMLTSGKFNSTHQVLCLDQLTLGGKKSVGFYVPNKEELKTVEWIMRTFLKYGSQQKTLQEIEEKGILNKNGRQFKEHSLITLLKNRKYIGKWTVNEENKHRVQHKLLPYEKYAEIDLPHGGVVDLELWNNVQKKLVENAGKKQKNLRLTRVYPLSKLLRHQDGSPFHGRSAWGENSKERTHYYYNRNLKHPIRVEVLEDEAKKAVAEIIQKSPKLSDAIQRRGSEGHSLISLLEGQISQIENQIEVHRIEKQKLDKRLDFLLEGATEEEIQAFRHEYKEKKAASDESMRRLQANLEELSRSARAVRDDSFDWGEVGEKAIRIQEIIQENDPMALKEAYGRLFDRIDVGVEGADGSRPLQFFLKDSPYDDVVLADKSCVRSKMGCQSSPNASLLKPLESVMISSIQFTPLYKNKDFLYQKYVVEKLSVAEIAQLIFSARSTVAKHLRAYGIPLREQRVARKRAGYGLAYGKRIVNRREILHKREQDYIRKMLELRKKGFSYWKIAAVFNSMKVPTQTGKGKWHAKTVHQILNPKGRS